MKNNNIIIDYYAFKNTNQNQTAINPTFRLNRSCRHTPTSRRRV